LTAVSFFDLSFYDNFIKKKHERMGMKAYLLLCILLLTLFTACSGGRTPQYECQENSDCILAKDSVSANECCMWEAINSNYENWHVEKVSTRLMCIKPCLLDPSKAEAACIKGLCKVVTVKPLLNSSE
jgi:hypothetical protein